jgi:hypothetical protein
VELFLRDGVHLDACLDDEGAGGEEGDRSEVEVLLLGEEGAQRPEIGEDEPYPLRRAGVLDGDGVGLLPDVEQDLHDAAVHEGGAAAARREDREVHRDDVREPVPELALDGRRERGGEVHARQHPAVVRRELHGQVRRRRRPGGSREREGRERGGDGADPDQSTLSSR